MENIFAREVDKTAILNLFGCYCLDPRLVFEYPTTTYDYPENFHKIIYGAIVNIAKKRNVQKINPIDVEQEILPFDSAMTIWKNNDGWNYIDTAIIIAETTGILNVGRYYDEVRKYSIIRNAIEELKIDVSSLYDEKNEAVMREFVSMTSSELLGKINDKFLQFKTKWKDIFGDNYSFHIGDGVKDRVAFHKQQTDVYGYPFQSGYLTTVYKGMRPKKFIIISSISGGSKSRNAMANAINMAIDKIYDWNLHSWISTGSQEPVLLISTELSKEEVQDCIIAHIAGIDQDRIEEWRDIGPEEEQVLNLAAQYAEESLLYCEYMPDFTIDSISETIEKYVINFGIRACFFDYINDSPSLYAYYFEKSKTRLRTDQILFMFSNALKLLCNKYNIYLGSSTQMNDNYKEDGNKDASSLKGSKAIIEKADGGILALPVTKKDLKKLEPVLKAEGQFGIPTPNMSYYIYKNRGGKWKSIIIWTKLNLGTMRETDCFVTDYNYELITDIEKTCIDFQFDDVGDVGLIDSDVSVSGSDLANELSKV